DILGPNKRHLVTAVVTPADLAQARAHWRRAAASITEMTAAVFLLLLCGPLLDVRARRFALATIGVAVVLVASRALFRVASPADWSGLQIFSAAAYASPLLWSLLASPFDFLLTAACAGGLVALLFVAIEQWRLRRRHTHQR